MKYAVFTFLIVLLTSTSCKSVKNAANEPTNLTFKMLDKGVLTGGGDEGIEESLVVCNTEADWLNIKQKMNSVNYTTEKLDEIEIDFDKETLIGYFQPVRSTGGYSLSPEKLEEIKKDGTSEYVMHYRVSLAQGATTMALTQPYVFVKTKKIEDPIRYEVLESGTL